MDTSPTYYYGAPIGVAESDALFARFIEIRRRALPKIKEALGNDQEALRYYCGTEQAENPMLDDWAFVFDMKAMDYVMEEAKKAGAGCIFFIHGAHGVAGDGKEGSGRPTLMLIPATYDANPAPGELQFRLLSDGRSQQPGTGGGTEEDVATQPVKLPIGFKSGQYNPYI